MKSLLNEKIPVASSCDGDAVCAKCRITIVEGIENLSNPTPDEKFLQERYSLPPSIRISCQTKVLGDVTIDTSYW